PTRLVMAADRLLPRLCRGKRIADVRTETSRVENPSQRTGTGRRLPGVPLSRPRRVGPVFVDRPGVGAVYRSLRLHSRLNGCGPQSGSQGAETERPRCIAPIKSVASGLATRGLCRACAAPTLRPWWSRPG